MTVVRVSLVERFESKWIPEPMGGCWLWMAAVDPTGYGRVGAYRADGAYYVRFAHRVAYELHRGPIPACLVLDHRCRVPCCVNPWHLEPVTSKENILRGVGIAAQYARRSACSNGHDYTPETLRAMPDGSRRCRVCDRAANRRARAKRRGDGN